MCRCEVVNTLGIWLGPVLAVALPGMIHWCSNHLSGLLEKQSTSSASPSRTPDIEMNPSSEMLSQLRLVEDAIKTMKADIKDLSVLFDLQQRELLLSGVVRALQVPGGGSCPQDGSSLSSPGQINDP